MNEQLLFDFFKKHKIVYRLFEHQPVFTVSDKPMVTAVDGIKTSSISMPEPCFKTLFLRDKNNCYFLVSLIENKRVDLNKLSTALDCGRLSFGKPEELLQLLKLTPGSVTPYGLLFDQAQTVTLVLDQESLTLSFVQFHPMRNDMSVITTPDEFLKCMKLMNHEPLVISIPLK